MRLSGESVFQAEETSGKSPRQVGPPGNASAMGLETEHGRERPRASPPGGPRGMDFGSGPEGDTGRL